MCSPIWLCQKPCTKMIFNYASPDVKGPKTHRTFIAFGRTYFLVCQQTAPTSSAKIRNHCNGTRISKDGATEIEPEERERKSARLLTLTPMACCKNLAVFIVGQLMRFGGDPGGGNVTMSCFQGFTSAFSNDLGRPSVGKWFSCHRGSGSLGSGNRFSCHVEVGPPADS